MKKIITALLVLQILIILLINGCGEKTEVVHKSIEKTEDIIDEEKKQEANVKIEVDYEVTIDCGEIDCFEKKFFSCEPARITSKLMGNLIYYYEIIGPKDGLCEVKSKFTANPNPEWVDKEMTCKYDNTKDFETASQESINCKGPLYILMTGG